MTDFSQTAYFILYYHNLNKCGQNRDERGTTYTNFRINEKNISKRTYLQMTRTKLLLGTIALMKSNICRTSTTLAVIMMRV